MVYNQLKHIRNLHLDTLCFGAWHGYKPLSIDFQVPLKNCIVNLEVESPDNASYCEIKLCPSYMREETWLAGVLDIVSDCQLTKINPDTLSRTSTEWN